ncbi:MAG: ABC transporter ATP-binding protein, partial [Bradymonadaceae bacterium]
MESDSERSYLRRALEFAKPHRVSIAVIILLTLASSVAGAIEPLLMKKIFDQLGDGGTMTAVYWGVGGLVGLAVFDRLASGVSNWLTWRARIGIKYSLLEASVDKLHRLSRSYHTDEGVGAVLTRLERGIEGVVTAISDIAFKILPAIGYLAFAAVAMAKMDWRLFLVVIAFVPIPGIIAALAAPRQTRREKSLLDRWSKIYGRFNEVLSSISLVRSFAMEDREKERFLDRVDDANEIVVRGVGFDTSVEGASQFIVTIARVAAIGAGSYFIMQGDITVGTLVAFLGYVTGLFGPVQGLTGIYSSVHKAKAAVDEVFGILDEEEHLPDRPDAEPVGEVDGEITFDDITFSYEDEGEPVLQDIELEAEPGETVALVGPSGAGKSTMMALLQRFYDPDEGAVRLDGTDIRDLKQRSMRRKIGMVLQESLLFRDSIRDNIAYGCPDASDEQVEQAAKLAQAHEFITDTPEGYETVIGEGGCRLSGGERQRITIARALIKDPPILVLDEPTSNLDAESETDVQDAFERLFDDRTVFVIAHRLSTVVQADRIVVLQDGEITETGTHEELIDSGGYYSYLVRQQAGKLLDDMPAPDSEAAREDAELAAAA